MIRLLMPKQPGDRNVRHFSHFIAVITAVCRNLPNLHSAQIYFRSPVLHREGCARRRRL